MKEKEKRKLLPIAPLEGAQNLHQQWQQLDKC